MQEREKLEINIEGKLNNKFVRFLIRSWQPAPSWRSTIMVFAIVAGIFLSFGGILLFINTNIIEIAVRYDEKCEGTSICNLSINIAKTMHPPIFVYYGIDNFYQNHRLYIKSKSSSQLSGKSISLSQGQKDCDPVVTNADMGKTMAIDSPSSPLDPNAVAIPCGLIAKTVFTDTFKLYQGSNPIPAQIVNINEKGIAWPSDAKEFKNTGNMNLQWLDMTDEHFIVWMRASALPNFRKIWGRVEQALSPGEYTVVVNNNYPVSEFAGAKHFVMTTTGPFGGRNYFLPAACLIVGGFCFLMTIFFIVRWIRYNKKHR